MSTNHNANSGAPAPAVASEGAPGKTLHYAAPARRKPIFSRGAVVGLVVAASAAAGMTFYVSQSLDATKMKVEKIWHGTGTVIDRHEIPASQKKHLSCMYGRVANCVEKVEHIPKVWKLTVREASGNVINIPVTKGQFDAIRPGQTFTR